MSVGSIQLFSEALGKRTTYHVILPERGEGPFPVLVQLHGLTDDGTAWIQRSNLARHTDAYPFVIVLPDGGTHCYLNWKHAGRLGKSNYEDLIVHDIAAHVRRNFDVVEGPWAIGGLSMGGYGALHLGLGYPELFASIWAHSSKIDWTTTELDPALLAEPEAVDLVPAARRLVGRQGGPVIAFDCGVDDELIEENRTFHAQLEEMGLAHHYAEHPGGHTWDYWDTHVQEALAQHAEVLGVSVKG